MAGSQVDSLPDRSPGLHPKVFGEEDVEDGGSSSGGWSPEDQVDQVRCSSTGGSKMLATVARELHAACRSRFAAVPSALCLLFVCVAQRIALVCDCCRAR